MPRGGRSGLACLLFGVLLVAAASVHAHSRSQSFSNWRFEEDGSLAVQFSVLSREVTRLAPVEEGHLDLDSIFVSQLGRTTTVQADGSRCAARGRPRPLEARDGHLRVEWRFDCPPGSDVEIGIGSFFEVAPSHVHFARVRRSGGLPSEFLYTDAVRHHLVEVPGGESEPAASGAVTFATYVRLGVEHILIGLDHVAFLVALLLLSRRARDVVWMVTGFTVGHSITLTLAALQVVEPDVPVIEALIGFTIAVVAVEGVGISTGASRGLANASGALLGSFVLFSLLSGEGPPLAVLLGTAIFAFCYLRLTQTPEVALRWSPVLTVLFGLIHGFGFASVLMEIGLPPGRLVPALFGFNIGVEVGQLLIVAALWGLARVLISRVSTGGLRWGEDLLAATLCGLGLFWFVGRSFLP
ncbi:MAG: HupE/UreJ family protein [Myxococcota bacterium]|nr:HupE/UreJ family protein [Myxococcota bacterium]